jgi:WD repeat-containing protein 48
MLDERNAFDAEVYRDEMGLDDEGKEDQRINIGKWVLRYLFANLIAVEIRRDKEYRYSLEVQMAERKRKMDEENSKRRPLHITLPPPAMIASHQTPRQRTYESIMTPGIALATPAPIYEPTSTKTSIMSPNDNDVAGIFGPTKDYFSGAPTTNGEETPSETPNSPEPTKESTFMGRLKSFGTKKLVLKSEKDDVSSPQTTNGADKEDEKLDEETNGSTPAKDSPYTIADVLSTIRKTYETALNPIEGEKSEESSVSSLKVLEDGRLRSAITPSMPEDTPVIRPSQDTIILIAEQKVSVDGSMDLYRGTVASVGDDIDILESIAPGWLGELLLLVCPITSLIQDKLPRKEVVKISFSLKPHSSSSLPDMLAGYSPIQDINKKLAIKRE